GADTQAETKVKDFDIAGILQITSPEIESGKSRALETIEPILCRPQPVLDPTAAAIYRGIESGEIGTLLIDETDEMFQDKDAKRAVLAIINGGYRRGLRVPRSNGDGGLEWFSPFGPKVLAGNGELPRPAASRSFRIKMRRRRSDEPVEKFKRKRVLREV